MAYSDEQLAAFLRKAGVDAGNAAYLVAIAHPESGASNVVQQGQPYSTTGWGLWQITPGNSVPQVGTNKALLNPQKNADAAAAKLHAQSLSAWSTYTSGAYKPYFAAAKSAVAKVYGMPISQVDKLASTRGGTGSATGATNLPKSGSQSQAQASVLTSASQAVASVGPLLHGSAVVIDRVFNMFAPGQGWRVVFGAGAFVLFLFSYRAFTGVTA